MERRESVSPHLQLHFDFLSRKALLSVNGRGYVLPDSYPNKETAEAAAQKFAQDHLGLGRAGEENRETGLLAIWLH